MPGKLILVIGGTGAQGTAVINSLLAPSEDGAPSPYQVRVLTRDPSSRRAKEFASRGIECVQGSFDNLATVAAAFEGVYGAWVNTDSFTVGEQKEIYLGIKIFEAAKRARSLKHYVWSSLDYSTKKGDYNPDYNVEHHNAKGIVADFMKAQESIVSQSGMSWTAVSTGPYMDMLKIPFFGPLNKRADGTFVFATPVGDGHLPLIALEDIGFWARWTFDHRSESSGKDLEIASQMVQMQEVVETFTKVTGKPAIYKRLTIDEWWGYLTGGGTPIASERQSGDGSTTVRQNMSALLRQWRDDLIHRDMEWIRKTNPKGYTLESWMRAHNYTGEMDLTLLKGLEDGKPLFALDPSKTALL
ncbi:NAD-P-binding protein [Mycena alexandri]|uniref:NAD-P-binding protein n=1 Tax=Mycena alexandri TaxID=1745969 RepID=A0AAD6SXR8_9AGAR|nr:NAD-P-binding protein [Mycena alexandri]